VAGADPAYRRLLVLFEEVEWAGLRAVARSSQADAAALAALGRPVGIAVRVGLPEAGWGPEVEQATLAAVRRVRERAEAGGLQPAELHLDLDVPTNRLPDYADWLPRVRAAWPDVPLTITGLPDWLRNRGLPRVLQAVDGWVLQVHWLRPVSPEVAPGWYEPPPPSALYDVTEAREAVAAAAGLGHPYRVALPTYESGGVRADPAEIAGLVERWSAAPPEHLQGYAWFRLPVAGDDTTWPVTALAAVREGRAPRAGVRAAANLVDGAWDVSITVDGEDTWRGGCVTVRWSGVAGADAEALDGRVTLADGQAWWTTYRAVRPGETRTVGWIRLAAGGSIDAVQTVDDDAACGARAPGVPPG
jgi:hypothetical protein